MAPKVGPRAPVSLAPSGASPFSKANRRNWYFRDDRPAQVEQRVDAILADLGVDAGELPSAALQFALAGQTVSTVVLGMRSLTNVERHAAVTDAPPLTPREGPGLLPARSGLEKVGPGLGKVGTGRIPRRTGAGTGLAGARALTAC
ncbi:hypothetical protein ABZ379_12950 [Streptomyces canus]|uniref:hypothetical protein n=1 Tax=Streptomyces canus TaxID=58343 RepID=UPI0033EFC8C0